MKKPYSSGTIVLNPLKIQEKLSKKKIFWHIILVLNLLFRAKNFFRLQLVPGTTIQKIDKKTQVLNTVKNPVVLEGSILKHWNNC
jgi:hypothetical protein